MNTLYQIICVLAVLVVVAILICLLAVHKSKGLKSRIAFWQGALDYVMATKPNGDCKNRALLEKSKAKFAAASQDKYSAGVLHRNSKSKNTIRAQSNRFLDKIQFDNVDLY